MADKRFSTPVGTAVYPRLSTPDTKFNDLGIYKADVAIPAADASDLMKELAAIFKGHTGKAPSKKENTMWVYEEDDEGEETGNVILKLRVKNVLSKKTGQVWDRRPKLFGADLKPVDVNPWGGTKMAVSFETYEWDAGGKKGVSLQPVAVQIIELIEGGTAGGDAYGFGATEGFTAPEPAAEYFDEESGNKEPPEVDDEYDDAADY